MTGRIIMALGVLAGVDMAFFLSLIYTRVRQKAYLY